MALGRTGWGTGVVEKDVYLLFFLLREIERRERGRVYCCAEDMEGEWSD